MTSRTLEAVADRLKDSPASPTAASAAQAGRRSDIQGLRAVAVLAVVIFHANPAVMPGGFVGVDVFFVISGFVITEMLRREWDKHGRIRFGKFYLKRFKRLTPALAVTVLVTVALSTLLLSPLGPQQNTAQAGVGAMLLSANIVIARTTGGYFDTAAESNALLHTWSLSVEEQFYLLFPLILATSWAAVRRWRTRQVPVATVALIGLLSLGLAVVGSSGTIAIPDFIPGVLVGFYGPATRTWEFAAGALLALTLHNKPALPHRLTLASGILGAAGLLASLWLITGTTPFPGPWTLLPVIATVLLILAGAGTPNFLSRGLSTPVMTTIGDLSYSLYLWHWPFIVFAATLWNDSPLAMALAAAASILPAYASYRWIEQPIRTMTITSPTHLGRVVTTTLAPPLALSVTLGFVVAHGYWSPTVQRYQASATTLHVDARSGCDSKVPLGQRPADSCQWNADAPGAPIYLLGDSNAGHFSEAVIGAGNALERPVVIATSSACPLVSGYLERSSFTRLTNQECHSQVRGTLEHLEASRPGTVVVAATDKYWWDEDFAYGTDATTASKDSARKHEVLQGELTVTVRALQAAGHRVVLVQAIPRRQGAYEWNPEDCSALDVLAPNGCGEEMPLRVAESLQANTRHVIETVATQTGAQLFDPGPALCPQGICTVQDADFVRLRDNSHLSVAQSEALTPAFTDVLRSAG